MAYEFRDFGAGASGYSPPSLLPIINGNTLDTYLSFTGFSFRTLTVDGRGKTNYKIDSQEVDNRDGVIHRYRSLTARNIVIRAEVRAVSNEVYRSGMSRLQYLMYSTEVHTLAFTDDPNYQFYGVVQRVEDEDERSNRQIVEIEFVCADPFKYSSSLYKYNTTTGIGMSLNTDISVIPEEIKLTFSSVAAASDWTLTNGMTSKRITFKSSNVTSNVVTIQQKNNHILNNNYNLLADMNVIYSDFDDFKINDGDILIVPGVTSIEVTYRGASL